MRTVLAALAVSAMTIPALAAGVLPLDQMPDDGLVAIRMLVAWDCRAMIGPSFYLLSKTQAYESWSRTYGPAAAANEVRRIEARFVAGDYKKQSNKSPQLCLYAFNDLSLRIRMNDDVRRANASGY